MARSRARRARAHPHAGGENTLIRADDKNFKGSSPRGRGKPLGGQGAGREQGLIPTRAGKTRRRRRGACHTWAHPHAGGENFRHGIEAPLDLGSSPRGRGKRERNVQTVDVHRLIPTRAGKTRGYASRPGPSRAHPHAGGENIEDVRAVPTALGSSPRGRGKHFLTCAFIKWIGQILETLELAVSSGNYSLCDVYATDAPQDQARNTGLALPSSRAAS